jgi:hypothetical protein
MISVVDSSVIDHGLQKNCIGGVMISVVDSSVIDHGLQTNRVDYTNHYTSDAVFL